MSKVDRQQYRDVSRNRNHYGEWNQSYGSRDREYIRNSGREKIISRHNDRNRDNYRRDSRERYTSHRVDRDEN